MKATKAKMTTNTNTNTNTATLRYFSGNIACGLDPAPKGEWEDGVFILREEEGPFKVGDRFLPRPEDSEDPSAFNDGTGGYYLDLMP